MKCALGDQVLVKKLSKHGRVTEIHQDGSIIVSIGSLKVRCLQNEYEVTGQAKNFDRGTVSIKANKPATKESFKIDLHGMTVSEALEAIEQALSQALLAEASRLEVIHGIGTGALKKAVTKYLSTAPGVAKLSSETNNTGVTIVYLN